MELLAQIVVLLVALLHGYFMILEMFLWDKPAGLRAFGHSKVKAGMTKVLAANQGLYNGFVVGIISRRGRIRFYGFLFVLRDRCRYLWRLFSQPKNFFHPGPSRLSWFAVGVISLNISCENV